MINEVERATLGRTTTDGYNKMALKVETFSKVIDSQQALLNNYRLNPSEMQKKYDAALQALAAERVQNSILKGQIEALKAKKHLPGSAARSASEKSKQAERLIKEADQVVAEYEAWINGGYRTKGERIQESAVAHLRAAAICYAAAIKELI